MACGVSFWQIWDVFLGARENTFRKTNIALENGWLEYEFPFGMAFFQVLCWFQGVYFFFTLKIEEDEPILTSIFF